MFDSFWSIDFFLSFYFFRDLKTQSKDLLNFLLSYSIEILCKFYFEDHCFYFSYFVVFEFKIKLTTSVSSLSFEISVDKFVVNSKIPEFFKFLVLTNQFLILDIVGLWSEYKLGF